MDLRQEIDLAIMDIRDKNYGIAEERLFKFLDLLDGKMGSQPDNPNDPAAEYRKRYPMLDTGTPSKMGDSY